MISDRKVLGAVSKPPQVASSRTEGGAQDEERSSNMVGSGGHFGCLGSGLRVLPPAR